MGCSAMSSDQSHYAYGPNNAEVEAVMRFGAVKRWHMIDTTRQQTLAEHSAAVAALVYLCAMKANSFFGSAFVVAGHALLHDMAETFTGDFPSHSKSRIAGVKDLEEEMLPDIWKSYPNNDQRLLIKLCDLADGIRFIRLHGIDITSKHAREGLEEQLRKKKIEAKQAWPDEVVCVVINHIHFYAYELS